MIRIDQPIASSFGLMIQGLFWNLVSVGYMIKDDYLDLIRVSFNSKMLDYCYLSKSPPQQLCIILFVQYLHGQIS